MRLQQSAPRLLSSPTRQRLLDKPLENAGHATGLGISFRMRVVYLREVLAITSIFRHEEAMKMTETALQGQEYAGVSIPPAGTYELDPSHTVVGFVARHMLSKVRGQFTGFTGAVDVGDSPESSRVQVEVKTESITTHTAKRDQHLMSGDFLEIEKYPALTFKSTAVRPTGGTSFELEGDLTIKDVTRHVTLSGEFLGWGPNMEGKPMLAASAKTTIDREDFGMTWNMAVEAGGFLVGKKVEIEIEIEAHRVG
jgi:polyisoprenoid-binding protein YceI